MKKRSHSGPSAQVASLRHHFLETHHLLLEIGRLAIKDVHWLHAIVDHSQRSVKESHEVTG